MVIVVIVVFKTYRGEKIFFNKCIIWKIKKITRVIIEKEGDHYDHPDQASNGAAFRRSP